jgi:hypothetical protein
MQNYLGGPLTSLPTIQVGPSVHLLGRKAGFKLATAQSENWTVWTLLFVDFRNKI